MARLADPVMQLVVRSVLAAATLGVVVLSGGAAHGWLQPPDRPDADPAPTNRAHEGPPLPEVEIVLASGQIIVGRLVEQDDQRVVIVIGGIRTALRRAQIDRLTILPPVRERYRRMREAIDDDDAERLLLLVEWLRVREQFDLALKEVNHVLDLRPNDPDATRLKTLIQQQQRLVERRGRHDPAAADPSADPVRFPLLSPEQINLLKVFEIDLSDPPRLLIRRETIQRLIEKYADSDLIPSTAEGRRAMERWHPARILDLMFRLRAREFYGQVQVLGHPKSIRLFRDDVHRKWLINACASNRCHGGAQAGRLILFNRRRNADASVYTNFLILNRATTADGTPLIDPKHPARSPLLQVALRPSASSRPHPQTPGFRPVFRSEDDPAFRKAVQWIRSLYTPRPQYPIDYDPPRPEVASGLGQAPPDR